MHIHQVLVVYASFAAIVSATPTHNPRAFEGVLNKRQSSGNASSSASSSLIVDLGYEQYQGVANQTTNLTTWKGIRYAAPPIGTLRWQPPQAPAINRSQILPGDTLSQNCPQSPDAPIASGFNYTGNEDCLFLSVYTPQNASNLPVLVWIHGGGYGQGQGNEDMSSIINTNNNSFVAVAIQYRVSSLLSQSMRLRAITFTEALTDRKAGCFWLLILRRGHEIWGCQCRIARSNVRTAVGAELHRVVRRKRIPSDY